MSEKKKEEKKHPAKDRELKEKDLDKISGGKPMDFNPQPDPPGD